MKKIWHDDAWDEYLYWQTQDKKTLRKINELVKDIERNGADVGLGKPEPLKKNLNGFYSRRRDEANRLVYKITGGVLEIISCKGHYEN